MSGTNKDDPKDWARSWLVPSREVPAPREEELVTILGQIISERPQTFALVGEASAGKTVFSYNLAYHLAEGLDLAGQACKEKLKTLYIDLETPETRYRQYVQEIGRSDNLVFARSLPQDKGLDTPEGWIALRDILIDHKFGAVVLDPFLTAWPVVNEDDNAEANKQIASLNGLATCTRTVILAVWNTGKITRFDQYAMRGASARPDRFHTVGLWLQSGRGTGPDTRRLFLPKSKWDNKGKSVYFRFDNNGRRYGFVQASAPREDTDAPEKTPTEERRDQLMVAIGQLCSESPKGTVRPKDIVAALAGTDGWNSDSQALTRDLKALVSDGRLDNPKHGVYQPVPGARVLSYDSGKVRA